MADQSIIDATRLLDVLGVEVEVLTDSAHGVDEATPIPTCPGWTVAETLRHIGSVYRVGLAWMADGHRPREWQRAPAANESVEKYLRAGFAALRTELARHRADESAASWWPADTTYGFWCRRMVHETTIHRVDVETASGGELSAITEDVAVDGIDEVLTLWFGQRLSMMGLTGTRNCSVAVRAGGYTWLVRAGPEENVAWRCSKADAEGVDAVVRGEPVQAYLWLWGRAAPGTVIVEGSDEEAAGQLWALLRLATR